MSRRNANLLGNGEQVGLVRLEKADEGGEERRLLDAAPELICPDSGQSKEALRPPLVTKRCRKRGKGKSVGIIWVLNRHSLHSSGNEAKEANWRRS